MMNALTVAWKLRVDMLGILAAASPRGSERGSEPRRRVAKEVQGVGPQSAIQELLMPDLAGVGSSIGPTVSSEHGRASSLAEDLEETGVMPASQRCPDLVLEHQHA
ncbi:MAG TPA: hypothetical protein VIV60_23150 [Polyangiaceae bacterium]